MKVFLQRRPPEKANNWVHSLSEIKWLTLSAVPGKIRLLCLKKKKKSPWSSTPLFLHYTFGSQSCADLCYRSSCLFWSLDLHAPLNDSCQPVSNVVYKYPWNTQWHCAPFPGWLMLSAYLWWLSAQIMPRWVHTALPHGRWSTLGQAEGDTMQDITSGDWKSTSTIYVILSSINNVFKQHVHTPQTAFPPLTLICNNTLALISSASWVFLQAWWLPLSYGRFYRAIVIQHETGPF